MERISRAGRVLALITSIQPTSENCILYSPARKTDHCPSCCTTQNSARVIICMMYKLLTVLSAQHPQYLFGLEIYYSINWRNSHVEQLNTFSWTYKFPWIHLVQAQSPPLKISPHDALFQFRCCSSVLYRFSLCTSITSSNAMGSMYSSHPFLNTTLYQTGEAN
jgi:hypothetical protein